MDKEQLKQREAKIIELAVEFCTENMNKECTKLCTKLIQKLGRKRSHPLQSGKPEIWAAAAVYTICSINFMFAKSSDYYIPASLIADYFEASKSTISQKSRLIKDLLKIANVFDPEFTIKEIYERNPFRNLVMQNGFIFFG